MILYRAIRLLNVVQTPPQEALNLYESGIDLLLKGARAEPGEQRRQTLLREASAHMTRAEMIKVALAPPTPPSPLTSSARGSSTAARGGGRRGQGRGKRALLRPQPTSDDIWGSVRVSFLLVAVDRLTHCVQYPDCSWSAVQWKKTSQTHR